MADTIFISGTVGYYIYLFTNLSMPDIGLTADIRR